jgi:hypothetical protein
MEWPGGFIRYPIDEHGRLQSPGTFVRHKPKPQLELSYTFEEGWEPPQPGDDPNCVYRLCRVAFPREKYQEYRNTLTWARDLSCYEGWFVAQPLDGYTPPLDGDCSICGEAWIRHGFSSCDEGCIEAAATTGLPEEDQTLEAATTTGLPEEEQSSEAAEIEAAGEGVASLQWLLELEWYGAGGWNPEDDTSSGKGSPAPPDEEC